MIIPRKILRLVMLVGFDTYQIRLKNSRQKSKNSIEDTKDKLLRTLSSITWMKLKTSIYTGWTCTMPRFVLLLYIFVGKFLFDFVGL